MKPHIVILGAGFGGLNAAKGFAKTPADITVIDRNNYHLFQPLLYQVATAGLSPAEISYPIRSVVSGQANTEVVMADVSGIDSIRKIVHASTFSLHYDYLIVATGSTHSYFGKNEWEKFAPGLKTIEDATEVRKEILLAFERAEVEENPETQKSLLTFVIVGAGPTGVELAGAIAELSSRALARDFRHINPKAARIILVEAGPRILTQFPEDLAQKAMNNLKMLGVEVRTNSRVTDMSQHEVTIGDEKIKCETKIWAAGVTSSPVGKWLGIDTDRVGRVSVEKDLSVPNNPDIFVIGDCASFEVSPGKFLPGLAPVAIQQGRFISRLINQRILGDKTKYVFKYKDKGNLATIGRSRAIAEIGTLHLSGFSAWVLWCVVHIIYLIGFRNRLIVLFQWAWYWFAYQSGARLITHSHKKPET